MNEIILNIQNLNYKIADFNILQNVNLTIPAQKVTAIFGDSGSGKTTFLKILSLLFREESNYTLSGKIIFGKAESAIDILQLKKELWQIRRKIIYLAQVPNPLNLSIYKNAAFPLVLQGIKDKHEIESRVIAALKDVNLWTEVKDRLHKSAMELSGGQKQKLCIARALVLNPEVILMDEPTSSLDAGNKTIIEDLIIKLGKRYTIIVVSHDIEQIRKTAELFFECRDKTISQVKTISAKSEMALG